MNYNSLGRMLLAFPVCFAFLSTSCVNKIDDDIQEGTIPISFSTKISKNVTKTTVSAFEKGERVGLFATVTPASLHEYRYIDNLCLECGDEAILIPQKEVFYPEGDATLDFISYYPYQEGGLPKGSSQLPISVQTDQSTSENHSVSDFLVARATDIKSGDKPVELAYKHQLLKIKIVLAPKEGENVEDMLLANPQIVATGFKTQALYDLQTGDISELSSPAGILPFGTWKKKSNGTLGGKEFILIPQEYNAEEQAFILEWNGRQYTCAMPELAMKSNVEVEIQINALQTTSSVLSGIMSSIKEWEFQETGGSENNRNLTSVCIAALSFTTSDVYRVYFRNAPVAEICKEYLYTTAGDIASRAIVAYPVKDGKTDMRQGDVLQLLDEEGVGHGGSVHWDMENNSLTYTAGNSAPVQYLYIGKDGEIALEKPEAPVAINVSSYLIRDIRNGTLQTYPIVKIGTQYWMKEDLQAVYYRDSKKALSPKTALGTGAGYFQDVQKKLFFYNGEAVLEGELSPSDWKIPGRDDWNKLISYIHNDAALVKTGTWKAFTNQTVSPVTNLAGLCIRPNGIFGINNSDKHLHLNFETTAAYWVKESAGNALAEKAIFLLGGSEILQEGVNKEVKEGCYRGLSIRCIKE